MFLIFSHLIRNALSALKRLLLQPRNLGIASSLALLAVVASSLWNHSAAVRTATQQDAQNSSATTQKLQSDSAQKSAPAQTDNSPATSQSDTSGTQNTPSANNAQGADTTPAQSFSTTITHAGQITPDTLIAYNAAKNEKTYYGGDLTLSTSAITVSKSNSSTDARAITITSPDGQTIGAPSSPWDDKSPYVWITADASNAKSSGTSFTMFVDFASNVPNGTYQLHLTSGRTQQTADNWRYDNFVTVTVVD
jgi:hypothetical protein